jgi:phage terminase large subunit-like protein
MGRHLATKLNEVQAQIDQYIAQQAAIASANTVDKEIYRWYGASCPCGLEPGDCKIHPRARANQRPPEAAWTQFLFLAGRGSGKSFSGAQWARDKAETYPGCRIALVAPTAADNRDVQIEGPSGIVNICPPWARPKYEPSKRRLVWPNGSVATTFSSEEPDRLRGPQNHFAWADEVAAWPEGEHVFDMLMMGLRLGESPQVFLTTTPRPTKFIKRLITDPATVVSRGTTFDNRSHLPAAFFNTIVSRYEGSRLGRQEIYAEFLEIVEGAWFAAFDKAKHVSQLAEYYSHLPVHIAIDAGVSRHTGAVWFQVQPLDAYRRRVTVFGDYLAKDLYSETNARAILETCDSLPCGRRFETVRIDPASAARTSIGPAAFGEYERVFGSKLSKAPGGSVSDTLEMMEVLMDTNCLVIHPRCVRLIEAFQQYRRAERAGEFLNEPAESQSPAEDLIDSLRYGIKSQFPETRIAPVRDFRQKRFIDLF